jgi:WD40 repeat protein
MGHLPVDRQQVVRSIERLVRQFGLSLRRMTPPALLVALAASACAPIVAATVSSGQSALAQALVEILGGVGSNWLFEVLNTVRARLSEKHSDGTLPSEDEVRRAIQAELTARLKVSDEHARALQSQLAGLVHAVHGVQAALDASTGELRQFLIDAVAELGASSSHLSVLLIDIQAALASLRQDQLQQLASSREVLRLQYEGHELLRQQARRLDRIADGWATAPAHDLSTRPESPAPGREPGPGEFTSPYVGLRAFEMRDKELFYGRERLVAEMLVRLVESKLLVVVGSSGSGKSSVLRAGLLPALQEGNHMGWSAQPVLLTPRSRPIELLAKHLAAFCGIAVDSLIPEFLAEPERLGDHLHRMLDRRPADSGLALIVDQLEELFTLCRDEAERYRFVRAIWSAAHSQQERTVVVLGVRADFYARCVAYPELVDGFENHQIVIPAMSQLDLRRAIEQPAKQAGFGLETGLTEVLLRDLGNEPGSLPLLSHTLLATWQRRRGRLLTLDGYEATGGIHRAIAVTAESVYKEFDDRGQALVRNVFLRLTALGEATEDTRRRVGRAELVVSGRDASLMELILGRLARARLIILDADTVEVAHEALIRAWPRLQGWLTQDREGLRLHRQLTESAQEWAELGRDTGALYRGVRLATAREWTEGHDPELNSLEREFLAASEIAQHRSRRRRTILAGALASLSLLAIAVGVVALWQRDQAVEQRQTAISRQLAAASEVTSEQRPLTSMLLSAEAYRTAHSSEAQASVVGQLILRRGLQAVLPHDYRISSVAVSPDGRTLAVGSPNDVANRPDLIDQRRGQIVLWDIARRTRLATLKTRSDLVGRVIFSSDGTLLAVSTMDRVVVWDVDRRTPVKSINGYIHDFSPDGRTLGVISDAGESVKITTWDVSTWRRTYTMEQKFEDVVYAVAFSRDGKLLAFAGANSKLVVWDVRRRARQSLLKSTVGTVKSISFSPDGRLLAFGGEDASIVLWSVAQEKVVRTLTAHSDVVQALAFNTTGTILASASSDKTIKLWDAKRWSEIATLKAHSNPVTSVAFAKDGQLLASGSEDATAALWNVSPLKTNLDPGLDVAYHPGGRQLTTVSAIPSGPAEGRQDLTFWNAVDGRREASFPQSENSLPVHGVSYSPDGRLLAESTARSIDLWDSRRHHLVGTLHDPKQGLGRIVFGYDGSRAAFSPDGRRLAAIYRDRWQEQGGKIEHDNGSIIVIWDLARRTVVMRLRNPDEVLSEMAFSPDGKTLAAAEAEHQDGSSVGSPTLGIVLWDVQRGVRLSRLEGHRDPVKAVAFSPDGRWLASAGSDNAVILWDAINTKQISKLDGHTNEIRDLSFSPDSRFLASGSNDGSVIFWDINQGTRVATLVGSGKPINSIAYSPDGRLLAVAADDRLDQWVIDAATATQQLCAIVGRSLTRSEWNEFLPGQEYRKTCG